MIGTNTMAQLWLPQASTKRFVHLIFATLQPVLWQLLRDTDTLFGSWPGLLTSLMSSCPALMT